MPSSKPPRPAPPPAPWALPPLVCLGVSHRIAPLDLRERLTLQPTEARHALALVAEGTAQPGDEAAAVAEVALLDTCHRLEWYAVDLGPGALEARVRAALGDLGTVAAADVEAFFREAYRLTDAAAAEHLLRVAAGLDSMIVGEYQILGQTRVAAEAAHEAGTLGPVLDRVFEGAVRVGRRARRDTDLGKGAASVPSAAVALARQSTGSLDGGVVVLIGAGKMGVLTAKSLLGLGARRVIVSNRSYERAVELATEWDGCAVTFDRLGQALEEADVVIASTAAPHPVVTRDMLAVAMAARPARPLTIVDIAVPRDVEPAAAALEGVTIFTVDDLEAVVRDGLTDRASAIPGVEKMVATEMAAIATWSAELAVEPSLAGLHRWAAAVREAEVARALKLLPHASDADAAALSAFASALVGKLLHPPTVAVRSRAGTADGARLALALREMFPLAADDSEATQDASAPAESGPGGTGYGESAAASNGHGRAAAPPMPTAHDDAAALEASPDPRSR